MAKRGFASGHTPALLAKAAGLDGLLSSLLAADSSRFTEVQKEKEAVGTRSTPVSHRDTACSLMPGSRGVDKPLLLAGGWKA